MGWLDGWFGSSSSKDSDPLGHLDPKLREFLERESPVKFNNSTSPFLPQNQQPQQPPQQQQSHSQNAQSQSQSQSQPPSETNLPTQSLYQDGRYAHLWKTYRPLTAIESETKTDHEKLMDILDAFKDRKASISRAALENCALEQLDWSNCMRAGTWQDRMTMCSEQVRKFERCYNAQSRLLKALGYLSTYDRPPETDDKIQMRADQIYQEMMARDEEARKAREEGREVPKEVKFNLPELQKAGVAEAAKTAWEGSGSEEDGKKQAIPPPSEEKVKEWKKHLEKLPEEERAAEEEALRAEYRARAEMATRIKALWEEQAKEREARKTEGSQTFGDRLKSLFGQ